MNFRRRNGASLARGGRVLAEASEIGERGTNAFSLIEKVLSSAKVSRAEIECFAVGLGPGSHAGIRVALAIAQGWQLATDVKLLGIGGVEILAAQAQAEKIFGRVNALIDAQRGEFYLATFEISARDLKEVAPLKILSKAEVDKHAGESLIGPEVSRWFPAGKIIFPQAATLAQLAASRNDFIAGEKLQPVYLRETGFLKIPEQRKA